MNRAIFLDRDGTLNVEKDYLYKIEDFEWEKGVIDALKLLSKLGYKLIVVTNQSGVARGYYSEDDVIRLHNYMNEELRNFETKIDEFYYCPHHENGIEKYKKRCRCRKPEIEFFEKAAKKYSIDYSKSFVVGDKISDLEAAVRLGMTPVLVRTGHGEEGERKIYVKTQVYDNLYDFAKKLEKQECVKK